MSTTAETHPDESFRVTLARIDERTKNTEKKIDDLIEQKKSDAKDTAAEIEAERVRVNAELAKKADAKDLQSIERVVHSAIALILLGFLGGLIALVFRVNGN